MYITKVILVGDFGCGKTSLVRRFVENSFSEEYLSTIGVSISRKQLTVQQESENVYSMMMLWDVEGDTSLKPLFKQYFIGSHGFIIVGDLTRPRTINSIEKHINFCHSVVPNAPICIALNKFDLVDEINTTCEVHKSLTPSVIDIVHTSAKSAKGVELVFNTLNTEVITRLRKGQ